jgi:putative oxidoreductase
MKNSNISNHDLSLLIMRVALGFVILAHGLQKALGLFGGYGFEGTMNYFTSYVGMPYFLGVLVILGETLGMFALIVGLAARWMAGSAFVIMTGALFVDHLQNGFFMNWFGNQKGEGIEFDILAFGLSAAIALCGSGAYSIDHVLKTKNSKFMNLLTA